MLKRPHSKRFAQFVVCDASRQRLECGRFSAAFNGTQRFSQLDFSANADMMSDMKTFTVRELDRQPAAVLAASTRDGAARIRSRDGSTFVLTPEKEPKRIVTSLPDFAARRRKIFPKPLSASFARALDKAIRGE